MTAQPDPAAGLAQRFSGEIVRPGDAGYDAARAVWNAVFDRRPALVVRPESADDVAEAIRFAREQDLTLAVRGGGHSIAGHSTCDGGMVIDLSRLRGARVDPERRLAWVNGGALLGELDAAAQAHGLVCPVGVVSHTGVGGLSLGGGMGRLQRRFGLTIDNIRAVELVTADGRVVRTSADEHPDLFWGVRGAGANFGVATRFEFALHPLDGTVTQGSVVHPLQRAHELAAFFRELVAGAPRTLMASFAVMPAEAAGGPAAMISVLHSGSPDEAERDLAELRRFGPPLADTIEPKPYLVTQGLNDEPLRWGRRFYMKSAFLPALPDEVVSAAVDHGTRAPAGCNGEITVWAWGGAIADVDDDETAFTGRKAAFWAAAEADWDDPTLDDASRDWGRAFVADIAPFAQRGRYVNDVAEVGEDPAAIYGDAKEQRLAELKRTWDPDNTFRLNQNVKP